MSRWEPDAPGRLMQAALDLFDERGFEQTTVEDIARRAGLTERTFFRHFADKREVLFSGAGSLQELLVRSLEDAPSSSAPLPAVIAALQEAGDAIFEDRRAFSQRRQAIIVANAELRERELIKLATLAAAFAAVLRRRGVEEPAAGLAAEAGIAVFKIAFERWISETGEATLAEIIGETADELGAVTAGRRPPSGAERRGPGRR